MVCSRFSDGRGVFYTTKFLAMTKPEINKELARLFGWRKISKVSPLSELYLGIPPVRFRKIKLGLGKKTYLPDFCEDLNAINQLELDLTGWAQKTYRGFLNKLTNQPIHASAEIRAKAMLLTFGKNPEQ